MIITSAEYTEFVCGTLTWTKSYNYLGESVLSTISNVSGSGVTEFNHPDRLGTRVVTNQTNGTNSEQTTLPFGTALNAESTISLTKRFTFYERSNQTGLDYAINRTYDSKQGRFTQVDPIGMPASSLASPQTLNLYTYCGNDPVNHVDPDGLFFGNFFVAWKLIMGFCQKGVLCGSQGGIYGVSYVCNKWIQCRSGGRGIYRSVCCKSGISKDGKHIDTSLESYCQASVNYGFQS